MNRYLDWGFNALMDEREYLKTEIAVIQTDIDLIDDALMSIYNVAPQTEIGKDED